MTPTVMTPAAIWGRRSYSPFPTLRPQCVGSFVSSVGSVSSGLPMNKELEREAERDRER